MRRNKTNKIIENVGSALDLVGTGIFLLSNPIGWVVAGTMVVSHISNSMSGNSSDSRVEEVRQREDVRELEVRREPYKIDDGSSVGILPMVASESSEIDRQIEADYQFALQLSGENG